MMTIELMPCGVFALFISGSVLTSDAAQATIQVDHAVVGILVVDEEQCGVGNFLWRSQPAQRHLVEQVFRVQSWICTLA